MARGVLVASQCKNARRPVVRVSMAIIKSIVSFVVTRCACYDPDEYDQFVKMTFSIVNSWIWPCTFRVANHFFMSHRPDNWQIFKLEFHFFRSLCIDVNSSILFVKTWNAPHISHENGIWAPLLFPRFICNGFHGINETFIWPYTLVLSYVYIPAFANFLRDSSISKRSSFFICMLCSISINLDLEKKHSTTLPW